MRECGVPCIRHPRCGRDSLNLAAAPQTHTNARKAILSAHRRLLRFSIVSRSHMPNYMLYLCKAYPCRTRLRSSCVFRQYGSNTVVEAFPENPTAGYDAGVLACANVSRCARWGCCQCSRSHSVGLRPATSYRPDLASASCLLLLGLKRKPRGHYFAVVDVAQ
jgi:hypothetical protein